MNKQKKNKIIFIVFVSIFATLWFASLLFLGFATFSETITTAIQNAYSNVFKNKTLNLMKVTIWSTLLTTTGLVVTLLFQDIKKKYAK